jgi:hypothetical protein
MLEELVPFQTGPIGGGASSGSLRFETDRLAARADRLAARVRLLEARFDLTRRVGRPTDASWLVPGTLPHAGLYLLKLDGQPKELVHRWHVRGLAGQVPALSQSVRDRARAVVEADVARARATAAYQTAGGAIDSVLEAIQQQTAQTAAFLETLTDYNMAIARYVLAVLPPTMPGEKLVRGLVVPD